MRIKRFILFHNKRHPKEMGADEITAFLTHLAVKEKVSASTQNQAFFSLLFLYHDVLQIDLPGFLSERGAIATPQVRTGSDSDWVPTPSFVEHR